MGAIYNWECTNCSHRTGTSGPWEFYRDKEGRIKQYGHPIPCSQEAEDCGVAGFLVFWYCPRCRETKKAILFEFDTPRHDNYWNWSKEQGQKQKQTRCPACRTYLKERLNTSDICPACNSGTLCWAGMAIS